MWLFSHFSSSGWSHRAGRLRTPDKRIKQKQPKQRTKNISGNVNDLNKKSNLSGSCY